LYNDAMGDTIIPAVSVDYNRTSNPRSKTDLGNTEAVSIVPDGESNIRIGITMSFSGAFRGATFSTNISAQNPGLFAEVEAHEKGHGDQIMDAANIPVTVTADVGGNVKTYTGSGDKVIASALGDFSETIMSNPTGEVSTGKFKSDFARTIGQTATDFKNQIISSVVGQMNTNITNAENNPNKESDANNRASIKLGVANTPYNNNITSIIFNGLIIQ